MRGGSRRGLTMEQLDPRFVRLERVIGLLVTTAISLAGLAGVAYLGYGSLRAGVLGASAWAAGTAVLAWLAIRWPTLELRHVAYRIDDDAIEIRGGVLWRHVRKVPRSRVQHTDVAQGPLERRYGLATLVIHTAGTEHAEVTLEGLAHETALALRDRLLPREHADGT